MRKQAKPHGGAQKFVDHHRLPQCILAFCRIEALLVLPSSQRPQDSWRTQSKTQLNKKSNFHIHDVILVSSVVILPIFRGYCNGGRQCSKNMEAGQIYPELSRMWISTRIAHTDRPDNIHSDSVSTALLSLQFHELVMLTDRRYTTLHNKLESPHKETVLQINNKLKQQNYHIKLPQSIGSVGSTHSNLLYSTMSLIT